MNCFPNKKLSMSPLFVFVVGFELGKISRIRQSLTNTEFIDVVGQSCDIGFRLESNRY